MDITRNNSSKRFNRASFLILSKKRSTERSKLFQNVIFNEKDEELKRIILTIRKDKKSFDDVSQISLFLQSSQGLKNVLETSYPNNHQSIFNKIASCIKYEMQNANQMLFKYGKIIFN